MKRKGFTLVELLVVISIIALLLSILMPSLGKARSQAKSVVCVSNLKQLVLAYNMYTNENKGYFEDGVYKMWPVTLRPYFDNVDKLRCCPETPGPSSPAEAKNGTGPIYGGPKKFWVWSQTGVKPFEYGSYGLNIWISNATYFPPQWGDAKNLWRKNGQVGASNIPILTDSYWMGGFPLHTDLPPRYSNAAVFTNGVEKYSMQRYCFDRHGGKTNVSFMDWSVRSIGLKQLWKLKWHKNFDVNYREPFWPTWMLNKK